MAVVEKEYRAYLKEKNISLVTYSINSSSHLCEICNTEWNARPSNVIRNNSGCKTCVNRAKNEGRRLLSEHSYLAVCKERKVKLLEPYQTMLIAVKHECLICHNKWSVKPNDVANAPRGFNRCTLCASAKSSDRMRMSEKEMCSRINAGSRVKVIELSKRSTDKKPVAKVVCLKCGFKFKASAYDLIYSNSGCSGPCKISASAGGMSKRKSYVLGNMTLSVQGYEPAALDWLQSIGVKPKDIYAGMNKSAIPVIKYKFQGKIRKYFPDFYLPKTNRVVEVKSTYTVGLKTPDWYRKNRAKALACKEQGYDFKLLVFSTKGNKMKTPKNWTDLTYKKFCREFIRLNGNVS